VWRCWVSSWEHNDCTYSQKNKEIIDSHIPLRILVYKEFRNKNERITVNKASSQNTIPPELLNKQAGKNTKPSSKRSNIKRARNLS